MTEEQGKYKDPDRSTLHAGGGMWRASSLEVNFALHNLGLGIWEVRIYKHNSNGIALILNVFRNSSNMWSMFHLHSKFIQFHRFVHRLQ